MRTVSTIFELPYLLRPDVSFQQGTWQFMAADLVENPAIPHTPKHNLESVFWVLLWMTLLYMKTSWSIKIRSSTLNSMMSPDVYQSSGGRGKLDFMRNPCALNDLYTPDNPKMEELLVGVFQMVRKRLEEVPRTSSLVVPSVGTEEKDDSDNDSDDSDDDSDDSDDDLDGEDGEDKDESAAKSATKGVDKGADESVFASVIENGTMTKSATGSTTQSTQSGDEANHENQHDILLAVISRGLKGEWVTSDA